MQSVVSVRQATALEVCELVYASGTPPTSEALERIYDPNALYESPLLTASSRELITDLCTLGAQWTALSIPRPLAALYALLRIKPPAAVKNASSIELMRAWTEIGDVWEIDSFDGHQRCIVEHTLHVLFLPGLHTTPTDTAPLGSNSPVHAPPPGGVLGFLVAAGVPALSIPFTGGRAAMPSPLHATLPVSSRLVFNDAGRVTHHRDVWDVADVLALVPGGALAHWVASRAAGAALGALSRVLHPFGPRGRNGDAEANTHRRRRSLSIDITPAHARGSSHRY